MIMYWTLTLKIILVCVLYTFFGCISSSNSTNLTHQPAGKNYKWWFNQKEKKLKNGVYEGIKIFYGKFLWRKLDKMES